MKAPLQSGKSFGSAASSTAQLKGLKTLTDNRPTAIAQRKLQQAAPRKQNRTGLPDELKAGIENLSGHSLDEVRVHYNSSKPAQVNALAYAQGTDIYLAPGQQQHLPHEAWHVVQQKQGRVRPTVQVNGVGVNDNAVLEREADAMGGAMGRTALQAKRTVNAKTKPRPADANVAQLIKSKKKLGDVPLEIPKGRTAEKLSRSVRRAGRNGNWKPSCKKNILVIRFKSANKKKKYNLVLRSAGMGGKHPRGIDGRTAAHTEPQYAALMKNTSFVEGLKKKLGKDFTGKLKYSSNAPCTSSGGGSAHGCSGMDASLLGSPSKIMTYCTTAYVGGKGPSFSQAVRGFKVPENDEYSDGSEDDALPEESVRGFDLIKLPLFKGKNGKIV